MNREQIENSMIELPLTIQETEQAILEQNEERERLQFELSSIEARLKYEIQNEIVEEDGKQKKKYSNEQQREYAFQQKSTNNTAYQEVRSKMRLLDKEISTKKIYYNYLRNMHKSLLAIAKLRGGDE